MAIYAISDLHLSLGTSEKPMDVFGPIWENHADKINKNWKETVKEEDLVLLPGDFSWAMHLEETKADFSYLNELPGKKILLKGNHDYWWNTLTKMNDYIKQNHFSTIQFLYNNSYEYENTIIAGTRGWTLSCETEEDRKILRREAERLKRSIEDGIKQYGKDKDIIVCMHYPPIKENEMSDFIKIMLEYNVKTCLYGHLHGPAQNHVREGNFYGIDLKMVSCDYTNFQLMKIK